MSDERYNLVFKGELVKSFELAQVKQNISKLFKVDGAKLEALFSGKAVVLKKNLDFDTATKYRVAIKKAGARVDLVENRPAETHATPPKSQGKAVFGARDLSSQPATEPPQPKTPSHQTTTAAAPAPQGKAVFGAIEKEEPQSAREEPKQSNIKPVAEAPGHEKDSVEAAVANQVTHEFTEHIDLAPVGETLSDESDQNEALPVIDVSMISMGEVGEDLLREEERPSLPLMEVDISGMDMAPVGEDLLKPEEKAKDVEVDLDLSSMSLSELGARLGEPKPEAPPPPDVSNITLEEQ